MKYGLPIDVTKHIHCDNCAIVEACKNPKKSKRYACSFFVEVDEKNPSDVAFQKMLMGLAKTESVVADPWNIDDRDFALAPNFYRWCTHPKFLNADPLAFPRQIQLGLKLFNDVCFWCSSDDTWADEIPVDADVHEIPERLQLLKHGVCPSCGRTRLDQIQRKKTPDYNELITVAGQRCVTGNTLVLTSDGIKRISSLFQDAPDEWSDIQGDPLFVSNQNGMYLPATKRFKSKPTIVRKITTDLGLSIQGTDEHPIYTDDGKWTSLAKVAERQVIPIYYDQQMFGGASDLSIDEARFWGLFDNTGIYSAKLGEAHCSIVNAEQLQWVRAYLNTLQGITDIQNINGLLALRFKVAPGSIWAKRFEHYPALRKVRIPDWILTAPRRQVLTWMAHLAIGRWDVTSRSLDFVVRASPLAQELQVVLLNMGLPTTFMQGRFGVTLRIEGWVANELCKLWSAVGAAPPTKHVYDNVPSWDFLPKPIVGQYLTLLQRFSKDEFIGSYCESWPKAIMQLGVSSKLLRAHLETLKPIVDKLQLGYYDSLIEFLTKYTAKNTLWTTVYSNKQSRKTKVTYDLYVPDLHQFMANGLLNHNSGKCIYIGSNVSTPTGFSKLFDVRANDLVSLDGKRAKVSKAHAMHKKKCIELITDWGYSVIATLDHKIMTAGGWIPAKKARTALIETHQATWQPSTTKYTNHLTNYQLKMLALKSPRSHLVEWLSNLTRTELIHALRSLVYTNFVSSRKLVLTFRRHDVAQGIQTILLGFGILCQQKHTHLIISFPWAKIYAREIGGLDRSTALEVYLSSKARQEPVNAEIQESTRVHCEQVEVDADLTHPAVKASWNHFRSALKARANTRKDYALAIPLLDKIVTKSGFEKATLKTLLKNVASTKRMYLPIVDRKPAGQRTVMDIEVPEMASFVANGIRVHNSTSMSLILSYHTHQLLKLKNPSAFYRIKAGTILKSTIVGLTYGGAKNNVWDPLITTMDESPWFSNYIEMLNAVAAQRGEEELVRWKDSFVYFRHAALYMSPASPSRRTLRGATRVSAVVDELGHFSANNELVNLSGMEVWRALTRSLQTVRLGAYQLRKQGVVNIPNALSVGISSPYEVNDPIMQMFNAPGPRTYACLYPTWEFNPHMTREFLDPEFQADPVSANRDYGCRPPFSEAAFISEVDIFQGIVSKNTPFASYETIYTKRKSSKEYVTSARLKWNWQDIKVPKLMSLDAGATDNSFSLAVWHIDPDDVAICDGIIEVMPRPGRPVSFYKTFEDVMMPIIKRMNVKVLVSDRWQNIKILHDAEARAGVIPVEYRLKYADFKNWREATSSKRAEWKLPKLEKKMDKITAPSTDEAAYFQDQPHAKFIYQSLRVVDVPGRTVDKPSTGSDDIFRTIVLGYTALQLDLVREHLRKGNLTIQSERGLGAVFGITPKPTALPTANASFEAGRAAVAALRKGEAKLDTEPQEKPRTVLGFASGGTAYLGDKR